MQMYIKRGIQGRWKSAVDEFGDQYDPRVANSIVNYTVLSNSSTEVKIDHVTGGDVTIREDSTNSVETKAGDTTVGSVAAAPAPAVATGKGRPIHGQPPRLGGGPLN